MKALILFAHGSRDPAWAAPFERIKAQCTTRLPQVNVALAYLGLMSPSLLQCVEDLAAAGCTQITVAPLFLGQGGHLAQDLPQLLAEVRARWPQLHIHQAPCAGLGEAVLAAMADFCCAQVTD